MNNLTPYQTEAARAVLDSVLHDRGGVFTVEFAQGAGTRELSAQLETLLLSVNVQRGARLLKVVPTSHNGRASDGSGRDHLADALSASSPRGLWTVQRGVVRLGRAEIRYTAPGFIEALAEPVALVEVADAHLLRREHLDQVIRQAEVSGATVVCYGRPWNGTTAFEALKQRNREAEAQDGRRRHFRVTWREAAEHLPGYAARVAELRDRVGETSPLFQMRYELRPVTTATPLLQETTAQVLNGAHHRLRLPAMGQEAVASVVVTRLPEGQGTATAVVTIALRDPEDLSVVEHRWFQAPDAVRLAQAIADVVAGWRATEVTVEAPASAATGTLRMVLETEAGSTRWLESGASQVNSAVMDLITAAATGRLSLYRPDGSAEHHALRREISGASLELGEAGDVQLHLQGQDEGFVRGLLLLFTNPAGEGSAERLPVLAPALAS